MEIFRTYGFDKALFVTTIILLLLGSLMVMSASGVFAERTYQQEALFLHPAARRAAAAMAVVVMLLLRIRKPFYKSPVFIFALLGLTLALLLVVLVMPPVAKTNRWFVFWGIRFQPSELAKISLVLFLAWFLDKKREKIGELKVLLIPLGVVVPVHRPDHPGAGFRNGRSRPGHLPHRSLPGGRPAEVFRLDRPGS